MSDALDTRWSKESEILSGDPEAMPKRIRELDAENAALRAKNEKTSEEAMTDDTLRAECEKLIYKLALDKTSMPDDVDTLLAFARAQQAKGLREAAEIVESCSPTYMEGMERWIKGSECSDGAPKRILDLAPHLERQRVAELAFSGRKDETLCEAIANKLKAQATAREAETQPPAAL